MLATALNTHPHIGCWGEIGYNDRSISDVSGSIRGCIVMFNRLAWYSKIDPAKTILLLRNPLRTARSRLANSLDLKLKGRKAHRGIVLRGEDVPVHPEPDEDAVRALASDISVQHDRLLALCEGRSTLLLRYEEMCPEERETAALPEEVCGDIADFLEVPRRPLVAQTRKIAR